MKRLAVALAFVSPAAFAHPGLHHLNGAGHALSATDAWLTIAAVGVWALLSVALAVKLVAKRRRDR